jgi:hypothetical protein
MPLLASEVIKDGSNRRLAGKLSWFLDRGGALRGCIHKPHRVFFCKAEVDEKFGIVDFNIERSQLSRAY